MNTDIVLVSGLDLLDHEFAQPQLGQLILKQLLEPHFSTRIVNFDIMKVRKEISYTPDYDEIIDNMAEYLIGIRPGIIGFYTICNNFLNVVNVSMKIHEQSPDIRIFFGGPHATLTWDHCLKAFPFLSAVCMGESEYSIVPLVRSLLQNEIPEDVPGAAYIKDGVPVCNKPCDLIPAEELSKYVVWDLEQYFPRHIDKTLIEGGRGCPFKCSFCSTSLFWKRKFRVKPVPDLIAEMDRHYQTSKIWKFGIEHDMFTADRAHLEQFCDILTERGTPYRWTCSSRIDVLDEPVIRKMAASGCEEVFLGIETGSAAMQKRINKNLDLKGSAPKIILMQQLGIEVKASFIYGLPGETEEDLMETFRLMEELYLAGVHDTQLHRFFPLPSTPDADGIRDRMYFDEDEIDMSIAPGKAMTEKNKELIRKFPELFVQYYTFDSEVRKKYRWADALGTFTGTLALYYYHTCRMLLEKLGYKRLYQTYEESFHAVSRGYVRFGHHVMRDIILDRFRRMVEQESDPAILEMFRYEDDVRQYVKSGEKDMKIINYRMDVIKAMEQRQYEMRPFRAALVRDEETNQIRTISVPDWISFGQERQA